VNPPRERMFNVPGAVLALVALLAIIHLVLAFTLTAAQTNELLSLFAFNPLRYTLAAHLVPGGWGSRLWTFISYAFIHADLNHLVFNLLWLLAFGAPVTRRFGSWRFLIFCAMTAAAGAAAHLVTHWGEFSPMIGASAAVSGTMAAAMRFVFQRRAPLGVLGGDEPESYLVPAAPLSAMLRDPRILLFLAVWFGVNILFGVGAIEMPGVQGTVAWQAHIGGFLAGLFGFGLFDPVQRNIDAGPPIKQNDETLN
jgi:membrane associated rhomboid family serine protease